MQNWTVESQEIILWFNCSKIQFNFRMKWNETWQLSPVPGPVFKGYSLSFIYLKQFNSREHQTTTMVKQSQRTITTGSSSTASWTELNRTELTGIEIASGTLAGNLRLPLRTVNVSIKRRRCWLCGIPLALINSRRVLIADVLEAQK